MKTRLVSLKIFVYNTIASVFRDFCYVGCFWHGVKCDQNDGKVKACIQKNRVDHWAFGERNWCFRSMAFYSDCMGNFGKAWYKSSITRKEQAHDVGRMTWNPFRSRGACARFQHVEIRFGYRNLDVASAKQCIQNCYTCIHKQLYRLSGPNLFGFGP